MGPDAGGSSTAIAEFALALPQPVPAAGLAGVYVRARGIAEPQQLVVTLMSGHGASSNGSGGTQPVDLPSDSSFGYTIAFTSWTDPSDAPQAVLLVLPSASPSARAVVEVDCIVPFIVTQ